MRSYTREMFEYLHLGFNDLLFGSGRIVTFLGMVLFLPLAILICIWEGDLYE